MTTSPKFSERALGKLIQRTLLAGICLSAASFILGFTCRIFGHPADAKFLRAGVLLLIMTPVARVAMLVYGYARTREYRFAIASSVILVLLFISVLL